MATFDFNFRHYISLSSFGLFIILSCAKITSCAKPNVIIFFADDMGFGDLPVYGHPTSYSPSLNKLANNGLVFTQFYVSSPICTPSR